MTKHLLWALSLVLSALPVLSAQNTKPTRVLFLVGGAYHDYDRLPQMLTTALRTKLNDNSVSGDFTISKDLGQLRKENLSTYDLLMLNVCEQTPVDTEERQGLLDAVWNGMPLVALHCTFWSFQDWPDFKQVLGAFVPGHGHFGTFCLKTVRPASPILKGVPPTFELTDEPYIVNDRDPSMEAIVETCKSVEDRPGTEPEVWTKTYGKGRIFAMTFGHDARAQNDPVYQTILSNGLLWALGKSN